MPFFICQRLNHTNHFGDNLASTSLTANWERLADGTINLILVRN